MKHSKLYACLSYLSILIIIPALVPGKDSFVRFHLNQGLILLIAKSVRLHFFYSAHDFGRRSFKLYCADSGCYGDRIRHSGAEEKAACYWQDSVDSVMASIKQKRPAPIWIPAPCLQILRKRPDLCKRRGLIDTSLLHHTRRRKSSFILPL